MWRLELNAADCVVASVRPSRDERRETGVGRDLKSVSRSSLLILLLSIASFRAAANKSVNSAKMAAATEEETPSQPELNGKLSLGLWSFHPTFAGFNDNFSKFYDKSRQDQVCCEPPMARR